jgi:DNA repair exonuclease SbcCD ATPase subunit
MRITRLHLLGIRRHRDLDIAPAPGLTVIRGPNEAGKSSVQTALEMALFRRATSTGRETQDVRTWGTTDDPSVELQFEHDGVTGRLTKHFAGQKGTVELELDGQVLTDPGQVDTVMAEMTGLPSEKFLRSTASVRHQELDGLDRDEGALRDRLQQSISGADRGTNSARRLLGDAVRRYRSEGTRNPGLVKQSRAELERLQQELADGEAALVRLEADRNALAVAHDRRTQLDAQLTRDQDALDAGERAVRLETSATDAEARYMRLRAAVDLQARITQGERDHPSSTPLPQLKEGVRRLKDLQFQIQELESGLELQPDLSAAEVEIVQPPRWRPFGLAAIVILVGALVVAGISLVTTVLPTIVGLAVAVVLGVLGVGVGVWALRRYRRSQDVRHSSELQAAEIQRRLQGRTREEEQLKAAAREKAMLLTSLGVPDVYAADALLDREAAHTSVIDELRAEQRGVLAGVAVSGDLAAERDRAAAEMDQSRHALAGLGGAAQDPAAARVRALETLRQTQQARELAIQEEGQAQGRVDQNSIDAERVAALAESVDATGERLARQERRARIYELTLAAIDRAEQVTMKRAARYLEERMGEDLARITDDRYRRIEVNEQDLTFRVWSTEAGAWVSVQQLSRGTLDQVYLAARLGLVRQVTQEQRPPLIFDDPFVTFDDDRARRAAELLRDLAHDHQVLYLTTSDRYDSVADSVVVLPGPTQRDTGAVKPPATVGIAQEPLTADTGPAPDDVTVPLAASTASPAIDAASPAIDAGNPALDPRPTWPAAITEDPPAPWWQATADDQAVSWPDEATGDHVAPWPQATAGAVVAGPGPLVPGAPVTDGGATG